MANMGIMHIASSRGGKPICGNRRAHMATTADHIGDWGRVCKKCADVQARFAEAKKRAASQHAAA